MIVGICDDDKYIREVVRKICNDIASRKGYIIEIIEYQDGEEVNRNDLDILILDIEMPMKNGIKVKEKLQDNGKTIIIYVTNHDEMMTKAFGINVMGFILKKYIQDQLPIMLEKTFNIVKKSIYIEGINSDEILYIKAEHVYNKIYLVNGKEKLMRVTGKKLEEKLCEVGFLRIHRSYIANMKYIEKINKGEVVISGGIKIKVSERQKTKVEDTFYMYCRENARFC